jgi:hypothetical protein
MYIIYTAQVGNNLPPGCRIIEFADDVCLFSSVVPLKEPIRIRGEEFNDVEETLQTLGLEISLQKPKIHGLQPE